LVGHNGRYVHVFLHWHNTFYSVVSKDLTLKAKGNAKDDFREAQGQL